MRGMPERVWECIRLHGGYIGKQILSRAHLASVLVRAKQPLINFGTPCNHRKNLKRYTRYLFIFVYVRSDAAALVQASFASNFGKHRDSLYLAQPSRPK